MANKNVNDFQYPLFNDVLEGMEKKNDSGSGGGVPDYSDAANGAVLRVVWEKGPDVTILDEDIGPNEFIVIAPDRGQSYGLKTPISLVQGKEYFLKINSEESFSAICELDRENTPFVTFGAKLGLVSYTFWTNKMRVYNESGDAIGFGKAHFTLTTPSIIKKLQWVK